MSDDLLDLRPLSPAAAARLAPLIPELALRAREFRVPDPEIDAEIMRLFIHELGEGMLKLDRAIAARHEGDIRFVAHSLQGMGGTIGAPEVSVAGVELSQAAQQGNFERCRALRDAIAAWTGDIARLTGC